MATKAAVDTDGRLEPHRTDVKGHQLHVELQVISVVFAVGDTYCRKRVHLALKSDYFSLDL
jgi:hypothetical protein